MANSKNLEKIANSLSEKEKKDKHGNDLSGSQIYDVELSKVKDSDLNFTAEQTFAAKLFKEMNSTTTFNTTKIATGSITAEQQATIAEQEGDLPGITIGTSWDRSYAQNSLTPLMGNYYFTKSEFQQRIWMPILKKVINVMTVWELGFLKRDTKAELQGTYISKVKFDKNGDVSGTKTIQKGKTWG